MPDYGSLYLEELEHQLFLGPRADMDEIVAVFERVQQNSVALAKYGSQHRVGGTS